MATSNQERLQNVIGLVVWADVDQIMVRAKVFLEEFAPNYLADETLHPDNLLDQLRMDLFNASVIDYLDGRGVEVELSVEHDIATWIEANTPAMVSANLRLMEQQFGAPGVETHLDVVKLHQLIKLNVFEAVQQRAIEECWATLETMLVTLTEEAAD
ncbi:hypothetical protein CKO42_08310 [Lamprobacter modestohalophilus]|uniref:Uncharacterized protein n=1 Tax=Lamprobacter modestohalophilus TaxID=1064514 RepID=A0A9X0W8W1_9GAMM|nr:hypothetical protein [Lamprobacter modestohalophilus]MBK1618438.1 hypothetical protein [Lamprobacter modestohalophilus]